MDEDGIRTEILGIDFEYTAELLWPHNTLVWEKEKPSSTWKKRIIVKLQLSSDLKYCNNWKGIALLNTIYVHKSDSHHVGQTSK